jgi:hypothetical protein
MAWLPLLKAALPYVTQIAAATIPAFTSKPEATKADPVILQQIEELQTATIKNSESLHILAEKLQQTIQGVDQGASSLQQQITAQQKQIIKLKTWNLIMSAVAGVSFILACWAIAH